MSHQDNKQEATRENFADGSAVVTYPDGSMLIVESKTAQVSALRESRPVSDNAPPLRKEP